MQASSRFQTVASRFEPFVEELHSLFAERSLAYGSAEDLPRFSEELTAKGPLRSGVRSTVRGILRRVQQPTCHGDLVELILVAIGGTEVDEETPAVQRAERVLSQLVGEAMTSPVAVAITTVVKADTQAFERAPDQANHFEIQDEKSEEAAAVRNTGPEVVVWSSPPSFVWAALLCGALLAPCMYLLARPHGLASALPQGSSALPIHSEARKAPLIDPHLQRLLDSLNAASSSSDVAVPNYEPGSPVRVHKAVAAAEDHRTAQQSPTNATGTRSAPRTQERSDLANPLNLPAVRP